MPYATARAHGAATAHQTPHCRKRNAFPLRSRCHGAWRDHICALTAGDGCSLPRLPTCNTLWARVRPTTPHGANHRNTNASGTDPRILRHACTHVAEIGRSGAPCPEPLSSHARWQEICACRWCWVVMNHSPPPASTPYRLLYLHSDKLRPVCLCSEFFTRIPHLRHNLGARRACRHGTRSILMRMRMRAHAHALCVCVRFARSVRGTMQQDYKTYHRLCSHCRCRLPPW